MKIVNYSDITKLKNYKNYDELRNRLHICAAVSTASNMNERYGKDFKAPIISISKITRELLPEWNNPLIKFGQYVELSKIMREIRDSNAYDLKLMKAFERNKEEVLKSIRLLVECGVYPEDMDIDCIEEQIFVEIWSKIDRDKTMMKFRNTFDRKFKEKGILRAELLKIIEETCEGVKVWKNSLGKQGITSVVLNGFYYITPIQDRLIRCLEEDGVDVIFLNHGVEKYPEVFSIWRETFSDKLFFDKEIEQEYIEEEPDSYYWSDAFAEMCEGIEVRNLRKSNKLKLTKYDNPYDFVRGEQDRIECQELSRFYSSKSKDLNEILREFYPDQYSKRQLLSYPIGQFLIKIHNMWNSEEECMILELEDIEVLFSSGWLSYNNINAMEYVYDLKQLKPFVADCRRIGEWIERIDYLKNILTGCVSKFELEDNTDNNINHRFHKKMANPFSNFSYFNIDIKRLIQIQGCISKLVDMAKHLFNDNKMIRLEEHMNKVAKYLNEGFHGVVLEDEEKSVIEHFKDRIKYEYEYFEECFPEDIAEAITLLFGGKMEKDDEEVDNLVLPIEQIEGELVCHRNEPLTISMCMCDDKSMPGTNERFSWPLNKKNIQKIYLKSNLEVKRYIDRTRIIINQRVKINRYLFYCLLKIRGDISISWISKYDGRAVGESVYLKLLKAWNKELESEQRNRDTINCIYKKEPVSSYDYLEFQKLELPNEVYDEFLLCPRRFFYSYIAMESPSYESDFHQQFVFTGILKAIKSMKGMELESVFNELKEFFPQWTELEKMQMRDYAKSYRVTSNYDKFDGVKYLIQRKIPYFLQNKFIDNLKEENFYEREKALEGIMFRANNSDEHCKYCPHLDICRDSIHPIDSEVDKNE